MPAISVILPTRDRPAVLARSVASVLAQEGVELELLIVDNNHHEPPLLSVTPRPGWLADRRVTIIRADRARNAAAARNAGLERAAGEWISFLDDDDAYRPGKLAAQLALAARTAAPLILCGGSYRLQGGRVRARYVDAGLLGGDQLLNSAGYAAPFLFHRRRPELRFDEQLFAGEDADYAQRLLVAFGIDAVPVVTAPLVDVYQDVPSRERTNARGEAGWRAARKIWWQHGRRYSPAARRLFVLRALITRAKLQGRPAQVARSVPALLRHGGWGEARFALNAFFVSAGWWRGRWVT